MLNGYDWSFQRSQLNIRNQKCIEWKKKEKKYIFYFAVNKNVRSAKLLTIQTKPDIIWRVYEISCTYTTRKVRLAMLHKTSLNTIQLAKIP